MSFRTLVLVSMCLLAFSHTSSAQAIKDVNVVNVPDVWVQGATNPIPVVDVTSTIGEETFDTIFEDGGNTTVRVINLPIPDGKLLKLSNVSLIGRGLHANSTGGCSMGLSTDAINQEPVFFYYFETFKIVFPANDNAHVRANAQWDNLPAAAFVNVVCSFSREDGSSPSRTPNLIVSYHGYMHDVPTP